MTEQEPREINHQRVETAAGRFQRLILDGIGRAHASGGEIDEGTARTIAHVLGRALGRDSQLAEFGRTADGEYESLREEYLTLYNDPTTPPMIRDWIDWFGTYLVKGRAEGSGRRFMNEHLPPKLDQLLVRTEVSLYGQPHLIRVPADLGNAELLKLSEELEVFAAAPYGDAFRAYLTLADVNAADPNLMESFGENFAGEYADVMDAVYVLTSLEDWESEIKDFAQERGIRESAVSIDHAIIEEQSRELYDFVNLGGRTYAFYK